MAKPVTSAESATDTSKTTTTRPKVIRAPDFAYRLNQEMDNHPLAPDKHHGRGRWLRDQLLQRFNEDISTQTVSKWVNGEVKPTDDRMQMIAAILEVSVAWLSLGVAGDLTVRERKVRDAAVDGSVNLLAGMIAMNGGHPAFPEDDDARAKDSLIDLYAIIKGAQYAFHVNLALDAGDGGYCFAVPNKSGGAFQVGVIQTADLEFKVVEITADIITERGQRKGGVVEVALSAAEIEAARIRSFRNRI